MKSLVDIYEKLDINKVKLNDRFPIKGEFKDIIEFLESNGFEIMKDSPALNSFYDFLTLYKNTHGKIAIIDYNKEYRPDHWVRFADTSNREVSKNNPALHIYCGNTGFKIYKIEINHYNEKVLSEEEFLEQVNKQFGWK